MQQPSSAERSEIFNHVILVHMFGFFFLLLYRLALHLNAFLFLGDLFRLQYLPIDDIISHLWRMTNLFRDLLTQKRTLSASHELLALKYFAQLLFFFFIIRREKKKEKTKLYIGGSLNLSSVERGHKI